MKRNPQLKLLKNEKSAYGGELRKTRAGRQGPRPLATRQSMHLVLRSSKASDKWSFREPKNKQRVEGIARKFAMKYGVKILNFANVGNHLHMHLQLGNRYTYNAFIRGITAAIAMAVTGASRWNPMEKICTGRFWDYRPFTRVIAGFKAMLNVRDYVRINHLEGFGHDRKFARFLVGDIKQQDWEKFETAWRSG